MPNITNRIYRHQADYIFAIVRPPRDWQPNGVEDVPPKFAAISRDSVASFEEAYEDLVRCNRLAIEHDLDVWAVIESPSGEL